jgi:hypothetical protein
MQAWPHVNATEILEALANYTSCQIKNHSGFDTDQDERTASTGFPAAEIATGQ